MTITAITFDFWSTLYQSQTVDYNQRQLELKETIERRSGKAIDLEQLKAAIRVARETWRKIWLDDYRTIGADVWLGIMLQALNSPLTPADLADIQSRMENGVLIDRPILAPAARQTLADLSTRYKLAIISDTGLTPGRVLRQLLEEDQLSHYFTHLTFSDELGHSKPHPDAFLSTLAALGADPGQAVHVGDLLRTDVAGAQAVGMRGVQYVGISQADWIAASDAPAGTVIPDAIIKSHAELSPLLGRWNGHAAPG